MRTMVPRKLVLVAALLLTGCADLTFYLQSAGGQLDVLARRQPIERLLGQPTTSPTLKEELSDILAMRRFAVEELGLPDNASYRSYADLQRPVALWNVVAAPEFSLAAHRWCFPVTGCLSYRGYFRRTRAQDYADGLHREGYDVALIGVPAYSTIGWFDDPVLNTMLDWPRHRLAGLVFHELAHQVLYIRDDSGFNESFAAAVEQEGIRRWLEQTHDATAITRWREERQRARQFDALVTATRAELAGIYTSGMPVSEKRAAKARAFSRLRAAYQRLKLFEWQGHVGYDHWFRQNLNNAHLVALDTYREYVPAFNALLVQCHGDLRTFYAAAREIGGLPPEQRKSRLQALALSRSSGT